MGPLIMLYHIELFEYTLSKFCSRFTLLLELEWPSSWDSKTGVLCEKNLLPTCAFGPSCDGLSYCPLPLAPCPYTSLAPLYLTLTHFEQEATEHHAKPREAEILCREGLAPSVGLYYIHLRHAPRYHTQDSIVRGI